MIYDAPALTQLAQVCAPAIATEALLPLIQVESAGNPLSINVNHGPRISASSVADGAALVRRYVAKGYSVDVGLAQINSGNFRRLGLSVEAAFDPCLNLQAAARVLEDGYAHATLSYDGIAAISATYSLYNTGTLARGFRNGYVSRIWHAASMLSAQKQLTLGRIANSTVAASVAATSPADRARMPAAKDLNADWVIGETQGNAVVVFQ